MARKARVRPSVQDRNRYRLWLSRGVSEAFTVTRDRMRAAVMNSPAGSYNASRLWNAEWWMDAVDTEIAPVLWRIYWASAQRMADATNRPAGLAALEIEQRWRRQVTNLYGYADTVGRRVVELSEQGDGESRGWMLDKLGLVAAAGPMSEGIADGMVDTEALEAEGGGLESAAVEGTKTWLATGSNPRPTHADADGQEVAYGEQFSVGGYECDYPGDEALPPEERCNCYCSVEYVAEVFDPEPVTGTVTPIYDPEYDAIDITGMSFDEIIALSERLAEEQAAALGEAAKTIAPAGASIDTDVRRFPRGDERRAASKAAEQAYLSTNGKGVKEVNQALRETTDAISQIHGMPAGMPEVTWHRIDDLANPAAGEFGFGRSAYANPTFETAGNRMLILNTAYGTDEAYAWHNTIAHETGHYFDWGDFDTPPGKFSSGELAGGAGELLSITNTSPLFQNVMSAIEASPEYQTFVNLHAATQLGLAIGETGIAIDGVIYNAEKVSQLCEYYADPREAWARAYNQFVALEADVPWAAQMQMGMVGSTVSGGAVLPAQWDFDAGNFDPIRQAIREMFQTAGFMA